MHAHVTLPTNLLLHPAHSITVTATRLNTSIRTPVHALLVHQYLLNFSQLAVNALFHLLLAFLDASTVLISLMAAVPAHLQHVLQVSPFLFTLHPVSVATQVVIRLPSMEYALNVEQVTLTANIAKRHMFMMDSNVNMAL